MEFKELLEFIDLQDKRLLEQYGNRTGREEVLARTVKLGEEFGELCDEILASNGDQRKEKLEGHGKDNLSKEFADVIITTLLLAKAKNIDIKQALRIKIAKINDRYK